MTLKSFKYPIYKWHKNKGYGTKDHLLAIKLYGITEIHRKSFNINSKKLIMLNARKRIKIRNSKFILGDCLNELKRLETESVDMIFCDPPYFLQLTKELHRPDMSIVKGVKENWDKFSSYSEYDKFSKTWLKKSAKEF